MHARYGWTAAAALAAAAACGSARCGELHGRVFDARTGAGVAGAAVTLELAQPAAGPKAITVFSDAGGRYAMDTGQAAAGAAATLGARRLGLDQKLPSEQPVALQFAADGSAAPVDFAMVPSSNIAAQVPASAWLAQVPESAAKHATQLHCSGCHQFPSLKVRDYSRQIDDAALGTGSGAHGAAWHEQVRKEAWRAAVQYMRAKTYEIFPEGTTVDLAKIDWKTVQAPEYSLFNNTDEIVIAGFLSRHMPRQFDYLPPDRYTYGAPLATGAGTVIREFQLPDVSLVREAVRVRGSPAVWGSDVQKNRLMKLDPQTGHVDWFDVPYPGATGPHTVIGDEQGKVWVSLFESDQIARFDPATAQWRLYSLRPSGADEKNFLGGQAIVHDISFGQEYELKKDARGLIWLTLIGTNKFASLDPDSGEVHHYDAPTVAGRAPVSTSLYSNVLPADGTCLWFTQVSGYVGCFNTRTHKTESLLKPPPGSGPRRLAIDDRGILWVPYFGSGQLLKYDTAARKAVALYSLPDRSAAPYAVTWDARRRSVWVANANADAIYRFDPSTEKFSVIPLPRRMGYLRKIMVDRDSGDLYASYGNIPTGSGPSMALSIHVGD
ncbi:MAG: hypothetical protein ISP90_11525 [Nevskia sp.]|nr:hypothetical protein [Nevskia sp.]